MSELLPCPFCGGEAKVYEMTYGADNQYSVFGVFCEDDSKAELIGLSKYQHGHFIDNFQTEAEAIKAWNTRAERTCKFVSSKGSDYPPVCSACGYELGIYDCAWYEDGTYGYERNYCPNCGRRVER